MSEDTNKQPSINDNSENSIKSFLSKILMPGAEELGLLIKDKITNIRLKGQIKILAKSKEKCLKHGISVKAILPKLLVPLLENASLEDDNYLHDK